MNEYQRSYEWVEKSHMRKNTVCVICGKPLPKNRKTYCSDECAKEARRKVQAKTACILCGEPLPARKQIFCSEKCRKDYYRIRDYTNVHLNDPEPRKKLKCDSMEDILKGMEETGLQYGEYVARYGK